MLPQNLDTYVMGRIIAEINPRQMPSLLDLREVPEKCVLRRGKTGLEARLHAELAQDSGHMYFHRALADPERKRDLAIVQALPKEQENLILALGQFPDAASLRCPPSAWEGQAFFGFSAVRRHPTGRVLNRHVVTSNNRRWFLQVGGGRAYMLVVASEP
jgi:hypothetical protein